MTDENLISNKSRRVEDAALENLTKEMLRAVNKSKNPSTENSNESELKKIIKDFIERSEVNNEDN